MGWSFEEDKVFENAIADLGLESQNLAQEIALRMPGKTIEEIQTHIDELMHDVMMIEAGLLDEELDDIYGDDSSSSSMSHGAPPPPCQGVVPGQKRKGGGVRWTEDEHESFLQGLEKYGKGNWASISRCCIPSKSPKQVGSHAQKYFKKLQKNVNQKQN